MIYDRNVTTDGDDPRNPQWSGKVRLWSDGRALGVLHINLQATVGDHRGLGDADADAHSGAWFGRVQGSDYLVWGANLTKSQIEFPSGETADVVLRAGGRIQGLGRLPSPLGPNTDRSTPVTSTTGAGCDRNSKER